MKLLNGNNDCTTSGKATLLNHRAILGDGAYMSSTLTGVIAREERMHPYCLFYFFLRFDAEAATYDLGYPGLSADILAKLPVPNYSQKRQNQIVKEVGEIVCLWKAAKEKHRRLVGA